MMAELPGRWQAYKPISDVPMEVRDRVHQGALMLDTAHPGWFRKVSTFSMTMRDPFEDVLAQVYGTSGEGVAALGLDQDGMYWHGFQPAPEADWDDRDWYFLTAAWAHEAAERVEAEYKAATARYLSSADLLEELGRECRIYMVPSTWRGYVARGQAPKPARYVGKTPLWDWDEVLAWVDERPGQGARTDLQET